MISTAVMLLCILILTFLKMFPSRLPNEPPVIPGSLPFIGHAHLLFGDTKHLWTVLKEICKYCTSSQQATTAILGFRKYYVLTDPDDCLTVANSLLQKDIVYDFAKPAFGNGLVTSSVPIWKRHRKLLNPVFNQKQMLCFLDMFNQHAKQLVVNLKPQAGNGPFDQGPYIRDIAMDAICATAFGLDFGENKELNAAYNHASSSCLKILAMRFQRLWLHINFIWNLTAMKKKLDVHINELHSASDRIVKNRQKYFYSRNDTLDSTDKSFKSFLDLLFELNGSYGEEVLSDQQIRNHVDTFVVAGHDTIVSTMVYALLLIGTYPDVQDKVYNELQHVLGTSDRDVLREDLPRLGYLDAVLKETMRLYPAVPMVARNVEKDIKLKNYTLYSGNTVAIMICGVHMNPMWGENIDHFIPERWFNHAMLKENSNLFMPFSLGKRVCIGKTYAMFIMKIMLCHVLRRYRIKGDRQAVVDQIDVLLKPSSGHFITIEERNRKV